MSPLLLLAAVSCVPFGALAAVMGMAWLEDRMTGRGARVAPLKQQRTLRAVKPVTPARHRAALKPTAEPKSSGPFAASA